MFIESVGRKGRSIGNIPAPTHMPFANVRRGVTSSLEGAGDGWSLWIKEVCLFRSAIPRTGLQKVGDAPACGIGAGEQSGARWRTNRRGNVILCKTRAFA